MISFEYLKALHIIFVVSWFAGLFYIVRLFIYHTEAENKEDPERTILQKQYKIMEKRLWYIITWPSCILTIIFGFLMIYQNPSYYLEQPWMYLKLGMVFFLFLYQLKCGQIYRQLQEDKINWSSLRLRFWNELATLFLIAIVFVVVLKNTFDWIWGVAGIMAIALAFTVAIKWYKRKRGQ